MAEDLSWDLTEIKQDLFIANRECSQRGLLQSAKWAAEMCYALDQVSLHNKLPKQHETQDFLNEVDRYNLAKSYFDLKEYDRAAHFVEHCTSQKAYFLHMYARYLSGQKKQLDDAADCSGDEDSTGNQHLKILRTELHRKHRAGQLDGYCLYLYGVVLKKLDLLREAVEILIDAIKKEPLHWASWLELSLAVTDKDMLKMLALPDHWMRHLFNAHTSLELQLNEEALKMYQILSDSGLSRSTYIVSQISMAYHNLREVDLAVESYAKLQKVDPYRLEDMDTYSNLLYVKEMRADLAYLAHHCCDIDKYRVQTCCVIGNYYSLRSEHVKAVLYFQRALKLNPNYLSAWTLMGHEYMELKNTPAAIQAYRKAIEVNKRDYRAWYGLGQTYEILKMPFYCLYYYRQAQVLRPNDSRMVVALGEAYEKLERLQEAKKCYWKAHSIGDVEGSALIKLGRLFERLHEQDQAAAAYTEYINETDTQGVQVSDDVSMLSNAYKYLANYHLKYDRLEEAYAAAQKCTEFSETREEGKALLRQISQLRALSSDLLHDGTSSAQQTEQVRPALQNEATPGTLPPTQQQQQDNSSSTPQPRLFPMNLTFTP